SAEEGLSQPRRVAALCRELGLTGIIKDGWRLAALVDADGDHLGREGGGTARARLARGADKIIGASCYNQPALAAQALKAGADYIAFGAVYPSSVKPDALRATLEHIEQGRMLAESRPERPRPAVVAIGGITADNAAAVVHAGADSIALISGLFDSGDIRATAARCAALFT